MTITQKIAVACFLGAFTGALVALEIWQPLWWLGILIGGLVGYLSYEFKQVVLAVKRLLTSPAVRWLKAFTTLVLYVGIATSTVVFFTGLLAGPVFSDVSLHEAIKILVFFTVCLSVSSMSIAGLTAFAYPDNEANTSWLERQATEWRGFVIKGCNPLAVPFLFIYGVIKSLGWIAQRGIPLSLRLGKSVFIQIHSEMRLLCMTDSMVGALVGWWLGSAIVGGVVGAVVGVVNYHLISVRWLKLVPRA